jgi:hypothetical protein
MNRNQIHGGADMKAKNGLVLISCLTLVALATMATPAHAAGVAFQSSSISIQTRGEGLTETIGQVVLQATGAGTIPAGASITLVYSGAITNTSSFPGTNTNGLTCSIASLGGTCGAGITDFSTVANGTQLTVQFNSAVTFAVGDTLEISQVRMNVNALGSATTGVTVTLSGTNSGTGNPITFTNSQLAVGSIINPSVKGSVGSGAPTLQTCNVSTSTFTVKVSENYTAALTSTTDENNFTPITTAANGSLVNIVLSNIPSGFGVTPTGYTATSNGVAITGGTGALGTEAGFASPAGTANTYPGSFAVSLVSSSSFLVSTGGALTYTFAVSGDSTSAIETFTVSFSIGLPNSGGTAFGTATSIAAIGTVVSSTATVSLGPSSGIVSFATNNEGSGTVATIGDCVTNLLFPFTTNQVGFDSNIQISNTSADKLAFTTGGATAQSGTCTLTYYPTDLTTQTASAAGTAGTPVQFTTPTIPAGGAYSFAQSTSTFKGQSGYMFAVCRFLDAHGFSFVVNGTPSTGTISQGLLALVIPSNSLTAGRLANPSNIVWTGGTYEGLVH